MEAPKRSVFHRLGRRMSVFDRIGEISGKHSVFTRIGLPNAVPVCSFWVQGRCNRKCCRFRHSEDDAVAFRREDGPKRKRCSYDDVYDDPKPVVKRPSVATTDSGILPEKRDLATTASGILPEKRNLATTGIKKEAGNDPKPKPFNLQDDIIIQVAKLTEVAESKPEVASPPAEVAVMVNSKPEEAKPPCEEEKSDKEITEEAKPPSEEGTGSGLTLVIKLKRHNAAVTGVCLPLGCQNLYSVSKEGSLCTWDGRNPGDCLKFVQWSKEIRCLLNEGRWLFVAMDESVHAFNMDTNERLVLDGLNAPVRCMVAGDVDKLFCGLQDGSVCVWRGTELVATLKGHTLPVLSLCISGSGCLFSASEDSSIRVWDLNTFECVSVLNAHASAVTSIVSWGSYVLSGSLDKTLKVWASSDDGSWQIVHQVGTEFGVAGLTCIYDVVASILLCSLNDNSVRVYSLPSFSERGRISSGTAGNCTSIGGTNLFFTGDASGLISVWRLDGQQPSEGADKRLAIRWAAAK